MTHISLPLNVRNTAGFSAMLPVQKHTATLAGSFSQGNSWRRPWNKPYGIAATEPIDHTSATAIWIVRFCSRSLEISGWQMAM